MPELPEVETIKNDLQQNLVGLEFKKIIVIEKKFVKPDHISFDSRLQNARIKGFDRVGKLLIFVLKKNRQEFFLLIHLRMTGQLLFRGRNIFLAGGHSDDHQELSLLRLPDKHTRIIFEFNNGAFLFFNDMRKFGYAQVADVGEVKKIKLAYGLNPLGAELNVKNIRRKLKGKTISLKASLLNQKIFAGIGNIYADEILFASRLNPKKIAGDLDDNEIKRLIAPMKNILRKAIKYRGTTFNNFVDSRGQKGNFSKFLKVYGRGGKKCPRCGNFLQKIRVAQRGTVFCEKCQR
jgi:formamidopyrimidine-DNA glycosylase